MYPEEVEEALKTHPTVNDAAVVGVPDDRFGEAITALVEPHAGDTIDEAALIAHVRVHLAAFKSPKRVLSIDSIGRAANGKLNYTAFALLHAFKAPGDWQDFDAVYAPPVSAVTGKLCFRFVESTGDALIDEAGVGE